MAPPLGFRPSAARSSDRRSVTTFALTSAFSGRPNSIAMTTGVLLRRLAGDPLLETVSCVLLDEFHERSVEMDLVLGMLHRIRTTLRPELKLVVMSATLDPQPIVEFLGEAMSLESKGRSYPVAIEHTDVMSRDPIDQQVAAVLPSVVAAMFRSRPDVPAGRGRDSASASHAGASRIRRGGYFDGALR